MELSTPLDHPLVLSNGKLGVPENLQTGSLGTPLPFTPELDLHLVTGSGLKFDYSSAYFSVHNGLKDGNVDVTGALSPEGVCLHGQVSSDGGALDFPNGHLELTAGRLAVDKDANQPLTVRVVEAEASGQVGDYEVALSPRGQIYPMTSVQPGGIPLDLGARSTPFLDTPYILTLLMGPASLPGAHRFGSGPPLGVDGLLPAGVHHRLHHGVHAAGVGRAEPGSRLLLRRAARGAVP